MKVKDQIFNILRQNYPLRKIISDTINTPAQNVYLWAYRKQHRKVSNEVVMEILMKYLKITAKDILETKTKQK